MEAIRPRGPAGTFAGPLEAGDPDLFGDAGGLPLRGSALVRVGRLDVVSGFQIISRPFCPRSGEDLRDAAGCTRPANMLSPARPPGVAYDALADQRSFLATRTFLAEALKQRPAP